MFAFKDFLKLFIFVTLLFLPLIYVDLNKSINSLYEHQKADTHLIVQKSRTRITEYFNENDLVGACSQLKAEQKSSVIDLYYLKTNEGTCLFPATLTAAPPVPMNSPNALEFNFHQHTLAMTGYQDSKQTLVVGRFIAPKKSIFDYLFNYSIILEALLSELLSSFLITSIIVLTMLIIFSQQIRKIISNKENTWWMKIIVFLFEKFQMGEFTLVKKLTEVMNRENKKLLDYKDFIENSLEQSLLHEIKENHLTFPYTFHGTVARVDINGFSSVVAEHPDQVSYLLTEFMENIGCELLNRYSGLFEKTVGDEIIVVFRGENSQLYAVAFIRDLMNEFSKVEFEINSTKQTFLMKGTFSSSPIHFRKRRSGYGFDGFALTLTARLLSTVQRKDINIVSALSSDLNAVKNLVSGVSQEEDFHFKNMSSDKGVFIEKFKSLSEFDSNSDHSYFDYFRSDESIIEILKIISSPTFAYETKKSIVKKYKSFTTISVSNALISFWLDTLSNLSTSLSTEEEIHIFTLTISLAKKLIPKSLWTSEISENLLTYLNVKFPARINSAVIELLTLKDLNTLKEYISAEDQSINKSLRIQGDLLIAECLNDINSKNLKKLLEMIDSTNEARTRTGIYASAVVITLSIEKNKVLLNTFKEYHSIHCCPV